MRKAILGVASALALASPAVAADLSVTPRYSEVPGYEREYEYRTAPHVVIEEPAPVVSETLVVRRPVIVAPPPVVVDEYPLYHCMRHRGCMRHLLSMRTPVRLGVTDGAIDVTSAAVGKVSDSRRGYSVRGASLSALAPKEDILGACPLGARKEPVHTWSPQKLRSIHLIGVADQRGVLPLLDKTCLRLFFFHFPACAARIFSSHEILSTSY